MIFGKLTNLTKLNLRYNQLTSLPESLGNLIHLTELNLKKNQLTSLPESITKLNCNYLYLENNPIKILPEKHFSDKTPDIYLTYHSDLQIIPKHLAGSVYLNEIKLPEKYCGIALKYWEAKWLIEEDDFEMSRLLIKVISFEKICQDLVVVELDKWQEYLLVKIEHNLDIKPIHLLKITSSSTNHIHILRIPPAIKKAQEAAKWIRFRIDLKKFAV